MALKRIKMESENLSNEIMAFCKLKGILGKIIPNSSARGRTYDVLVSSPHALSEIQETCAG